MHDINELFISEKNIRRIINLILAIKNSQVSEIEKCISIWKPTTQYLKEKTVLVLNDDSYSEYVCETPHVSSDNFENDKSHWKPISCIEFEGYTEEQLREWLGLSDEELETLSNIINDAEVQTNHAWSSSKIYAELLRTLSESKKFTISEIAKIVSFSYKVVNDEADVVDDKAIYLVKNQATGTHDMYLLIDDSPSIVGNTNINLEGYIRKDDIVDSFDETMTYTDDDKVFSTKASKSMYDKLNDKKINKSNIVKTLLNDTVTNEQVVGAKIVYELTKGNNLKTYVDYPDVGIDKTNFTLEEVATKLNNASVLMVGTDNKTPNIFPKVFGHFIALRKSDDKVKFFFFPNEDNERNAIYFCGYHPKKGVTKWQKVCTTSVPDVSDTNVNFISGTPFINVSASYVVKDGWCTIMFGGGGSLTVPSTVDNLVIAKNLPKPIKTMRYTSQLWGNASSSCLLSVTTDGNLETWLNTSCNGCFAYMSISYQVAEDWQP